MAAVGGKYAALLGKKEKKAQATSKANGTGAPQGKTAKVMPLSDTPEKRQQKPKGQVLKMSDTPSKPKTAAPEPEKDLTRKEVKHERAATDRHVPRTGVADHTKEKKTEQVQGALEAAAEKPSDNFADRKREYEERDAERKKREEEEKRKVTYADYQKSLEEKKAELAKLNKSHERKIDSKGFARMQQVSKATDDEFTFMKLEKDQPAAPVKPAPKKGGKKAAEAAKPAAKPAKKNKFHKSGDIQVGFYSKSTAPKPAFRPRKDFDAPKPDEAAAAQPAGEEAAPAAAPADGGAVAPDATATAAAPATADDEW